MRSTQQKFDYEKKRWGATPIKNLWTDFQGLELFFFLDDVVPLLAGEKITLLDSGCGAGNIPAFFKKQFPKWKIIGIDISDSAIYAARNRFSKVKFIKTEAHQIPEPDESIDIITSFDSLEHYENLDEVLDEIKRVIKKNGIFYVSIPLEKQFLTLYWLMYKFGWRGKKHFAGHVNFFTDKELVNRVESYGFRLLKKRFSFHFLFSVFDIGYYMLQAIFGRSDFSFETSVSELKPGIKRASFIFFKKTIALIGFLESRALFWFPGGKGHFLFILNKEDFFSGNPPLTVAEDCQMAFGLKRAFAPRDLEIQKHLGRLAFDKAKKVLDFGCANGIWLERLLQEGKKEGAGIDISDKLIDIANRRKGKLGLYFSNREKWPLRENLFDFCVSFDTFEHVKDKKNEMKRIYFSMKKGGKFFFYTLNPNNKFTIDWLFEKIGSSYMYRRADHKKELYISPQSFAKALSAVGFKNIRYSLYDGPANLLWRIICYLFLSTTEKITTVLHIPFLMKLAVISNDWFLRLIRPLNNFIDSFFLNRGYSNGYFIWGEK